jgi:orotate phosphoribosyltransferase
VNPLASLPDTPKERLSALRAVLLNKGVTKLAEPVELSSGAMSRYFIDGKKALCSGADLALACTCMMDLLAAHSITADAVGGLTLGADQFAHGVSIVGGLEWFVVRKAAKGRGTNKFIEGADLNGKRILLVDDVISTGASTLVADERITAEGGTSVLATTLVARSDEPAERFQAAGIPFAPLFTYLDLGIPAVGTE